MRYKTGSVLIDTRENVCVIIGQHNEEMYHCLYSVLGFSAYASDKWLNRLIIKRTL